MIDVNLRSICICMQNYAPIVASQDQAVVRIAFVRHLGEKDVTRQEPELKSGIGTLGYRSVELAQNPSLWSLQV